MITARMLAFQILLHLERNVSHPDRLIRSNIERHSGLEPRDRALMTELVYGVLRWQGRLDWHIDQLSSVKPAKISQPIRILLRLALYQVLMLDRIPQHAAVNEAVKIARATQPSYLVGFVNAVLRAALRRHPDWEWPDPERNPEEYLAVTTSHPRWVIRRWLQELGFEHTRDLCLANNTAAPMVLRVNRLKGRASEVIERLGGEGVEALPSPYLPDAVRASGLRRDITALGLYEEGLIQVQDEASQLVTLLLSPKPGERVLDLCAGFGGKSTHIGILMGNEGTVVSVDEAAWKLEELRRNARRQGVGIIETVAADVLELSPERLGSFDRVLLDAPCSGFGTIRRNPDIKWRRHLKDPHRFSRIQKALLQHGARFVKRGGTLVYSTCTVFREEDEEVAAHFSSTHAPWRLEPPEEFLPPSCRSMVEGGYFRSWPHRHGIDGFFAARWVRGG